MTPLEEFYQGKNFLVTGGTGFLGLSLVEKLLRSFPGIGSIYMILRAKKSEKLEDRKKQFLEHQIFDRLKKEYPNYQELFNKIKWVEGELGRPNLGIQPETFLKLQGVINIVFHSAAAINFNFPLKKYVDMNLKSTEDLLEFAKGCANLSCFLYMSTAYCQARKSRCHITETILKHPTNPRELLNMAATLTNEEMEAHAKELVTDWANYYAYCKNATENLLLEYGDSFGIVVYRPGIVVHSVAEPAPYWIGNRLGFPRALMEANRGLVLFLDPDVAANTVPVDYTTNGSLAAIYRTSIDKSFKVYNFTTNNNPITFMKGYQYYCLSVPNYEDVLVPRRYELSNMKNVQPGSTEERLIKEIKSYAYFHNMIKYFTDTPMTYANTNIEELWSQLSDDEQALIPFDVRTINWRSYYGNMNANEFGMPRLTFD